MRYLKRGMITHRLLKQHYLYGYNNLFFSYMLSLFTDEHTVSQSSDQSVTLTSHRICYESREWGRSYNQNIMLEHITSCENYSRNPYLLLTLGGFCIAVGLPAVIGFNPPLTAPILALGILLVFFYWYNRRNLIIVSSPSTKIRLNVTGMDRLKVLDFINKIEQTKHQRISSLNPHPSKLV